MTQKVEVPNTQIPTAGKLSIDDILLSMGEKGKDYAAARAGHSAEQPVAEEKEIPETVQEPESNETEATATAEEEEEVPQAADEAAASVAEQQSAEAEVTADKADDTEDESEAAYEEETVTEAPAETGAERPIRRPLPRRSVAEAAVAINALSRLIQRMQVLLSGLHRQKHRDLSQRRIRRMYHRILARHAKRRPVRNFWRQPGRICIQELRCASGMNVPRWQM